MFKKKPLFRISIFYRAPCAECRLSGVCAKWFEVVTKKGESLNAMLRSSDLMLKAVESHYVPASRLTRSKPYLTKIPPAVVYRMYHMLLSLT